MYKNASQYFIQDRSSQETGGKNLDTVLRQPISPSVKKALRFVAQYPAEELKERGKGKLFTDSQGRVDAVQALALLHNLVSDTNPKKYTGEQQRYVRGIMNGQIAPVEDIVTAMGLKHSRYGIIPSNPEEYEARVCGRSEDDEPTDIDECEEKEAPEKRSEDLAAKLRKAGPGAKELRLALIRSMHGKLQDEKEEDTI